MFKKVDPKVSFPKMEEEILEFWEKEKIFEKSVAKDAPKGDFVFYEGPPSANGAPGLHHVLARSFKDVIPRYKTMKGYRVMRKAGWDAHGLPVEIQVEKALGIKSKQEIENIVPGDARASVIEFNKHCKESVLEYQDMWEKMTWRIGYWVDMEHPYVMYENSYIESLWWQLAKIAKLKTAKGESFLYKGHKVVPYCYRCGTALSSHEVAQGYKETTDNSAYVKFKATPGQKIGNFTTDDNTYFLAWTTTPWTLPGNVALAVKPNTMYVSLTIHEIIKNNTDLNLKSGETYIIEEGSVMIIFGSNIISVKQENQHDYFKIDNVTVGGDNEQIKLRISYEIFHSDELIGKEYKPLFHVAGEKEKEKSFKVVAGDFVTTDSGTGIVHIAPAFGEDDANVARENDLPTLLTVEQDGTMKKGFGLPGEGIPVKKMNDKNRYAVDNFVIEDLKKRELLFKEESYKHEYPFCWRCDTPLIYYAKPSWFIRMSELRGELVQGNESINWVPEHIKDGRFGEWLRGVKDWAISRERYWGTPLPIWVCSGKEQSPSPHSGVPESSPLAGERGCGRMRVIESVAELEELSGKKLDDLHKPYIDDVEFSCECGGMMRRTPEVLDVWFDSGAMPLAQFSYPASTSGEEKKNIETGKTFPADYICEAIDQTRGWFYTLHAIANLLAKAGIVKEQRAYKNVICLGHILDSHGKKMSKSKGNVIDPFEMFDQYGADALRWLLFSLNQPGLPKRFDVKGMRDVQNRVFRMLWNSYSFFVTYVSIDKWSPKSSISNLQFPNVMDRWILSDLQLMIEEVGKALDRYDIYFATKNIEKFIDNLSNWYIRLNRRRFWKNENDTDKEDAYSVLHLALVTISKVMAPFTPFVAEEIYRNLTGKKSVHLAEYPKYITSFESDIHYQMTRSQMVITAGRQLRVRAGINARKPLGEVYVKNFKVIKEFEDLVKQELNVRSIVTEFDRASLEEDATILWMNVGEMEIGISTNITPELKLEGEAREIIRAIQAGRKKAGFNVEDRIVLGYDGKEEAFAGDAENKVPGFQEMIAKEVLATEVQSGEITDAEYTEEAKIEGEIFHFWLKRV